MGNESPLVRMREFYNRFPYPGRPIFIFPDRRYSWLSHAGFSRLCCRDASAALELWRSWRTVGPECKSRQSVHDEQIALVEREFSADKKILMVGCGTDEPLLFRLLHPGNPLSGIDLSTRSLARARLRLRIYRLLHPFVACGPTSLFEGDAVNLLHSGTLGQFDFIQCFGVLHHQPDALPLLEAMSRALKPRGTLRLMIYAHHGRRLERRVQRRFLRRGDTRWQSWRLWLWQMGGFLRLRHPSFARFRYLGFSRRAVADAFLHPSDPGLPLENLLNFANRVGLSCRFCEAKLWRDGWQAEAGDCSKMLERFVVSEQSCEIMSNIILVFQKEPTVNISV